MFITEYRVLVSQKQRSLPHNQNFVVVCLDMIMYSRKLFVENLKP